MDCAEEFYGYIQKSETRVAVTLGFKGIFFKVTQVDVAWIQLKF